MRLANVMVVATKRAVAVAVAVAGLARARQLR